MKKIVTVFSCFLLCILGLTSPAEAAVVTPCIAANTNLSNIIVIALILAFFLIGLAIGIAINSEKKKKKNKETDEIEEIKDKPQEPEPHEQFDQDEFFNQRPGPYPRNPGNRYYNNW